MKTIIFYALFINLCASCKIEFEETICENVHLSPDLVLKADTKKFSLKNATGNIIKENVINLQSVKELSLVGNSIEKVESGALCSIPNLQQLSVYKNIKFPKITKELLQDCQNVTSLYLDTLTIDGFIPMSKLETLTLNNTKVTNTDIIRGLVSLKQLTISNSGLREIKKYTFNGFKNLKTLNLECNQIETIESDSFIELGQLRTLNLSQNKLRNLNWKEFIGLKALKILFLDHNEFDNVDVDKLLESLQNLERIFFSFDKLTPKTRKEIEIKLPKSNVTFIYLK